MSLKIGFQKVVRKSDHKDNQKRILIIHTDGNSFNNPSLKCIIDLLLDNGCRVDLRYPESKAPMPPLDNIRLIPYRKFFKRIKFFVFDLICNKRLAFLLVCIEKLFLYNRYNLIIGVDRQGLIEANILNQITAVPYIFFSFEIMFESETSARYKLLEQEASKNVSYWLIQDKLRAEKLEYENKLQSSNRIILPLASAGIGTLKTDRLRDHLKIPANKKVAIIIGSLSKWTMTSDILRTVENWPENWVLIVHERYGCTHEDLKSQHIVIDSLKNKKVYISDAATKFVDDMGSVLAGVSVGLAFYEPDFSGSYTGKNLKYLGFSSGKISTYLRYGVPVILNDIGLYAKEAEQFRFGCVVQCAEHIKHKLEKVSSEEYQNNARCYFSKNLDFDIYKKDILSVIFLLLNNHRSKASGC